MKSANKQNTLFIFLIIVTMFFTFADSVCAEQMIITVPSSDILPEGGAIFKTSVKTRVNDGDARIAPNFTMGIGHNMNFSFGVPTKLDSDYNTKVMGDIGLKKVWFVGKSNRFTLGGSVAPSFNAVETPDMFLYGHLSHRIRKSRTSFTAGGYMYGKQHFLNRGGVIVGVDQVIIPNKLRVAFDWMSGHSDKGNFAVGLKYRPEPSVSLNGAVIIPNERTESVAFQVSLSKYFSIDFDKDKSDSDKERRL